jgi:hypothetical protein
MKLFYAITILAMAITAQKVDVKAGEGTMGMNKKKIEIKCMKAPIKRIPMDYPAGENEIQLDFKSIAELKAEVEKKNKSIEKKTPPAKILDFAALKAKFGDKMKKDFDFGKKKIRVFRKGSN